MRRHHFQIPVLTQGEERRPTRSNNTADTDEIKKWFDLDHYAEAKSLNLIEWYYQILKRQEISFFQGKHLQDAFNHFDMPISIQEADELKQNALITWSNILSSGVLPTQRGYFLRDIALYSSIRELEGSPGVHYPLETVYSLKKYRNHDYIPPHLAAFLWNLLDHIQIFIHQESPLNVENGLAAIHTGKNFIERPHNYRNRTRIHLELDLSAGDAYSGGSCTAIPIDRARQIRGNMHGYSD